MAIIPKKATINGNSADIINAIRNGDTTTFSFEPATYDIDSISNIGNLILASPIMQNKFIDTLINRIAKIVYTSLSYENPWSALKQGMLETGEVVEEIAFNLCDVHEYDTTEDSAFPKQEKPDVYTAFHKLNYTKYYKSTINRARLRQAFTTLDGVEELAQYIINTMYTSAEYDEFLAMKYLIGRTALNSLFTPVIIPEVKTENMKTIASKIKSLSNELTFMRTTYNPYGLPTNTKKENQIVIVNSDFDALLDVEVLAFAFNMDKADFNGRRILIDNFNTGEVARMTELLGNNADYEEFTEAEIQKLNTIPAFIIDDRFFMIFDNLIETNDFYNPEKLYFNYWLHTWKIISNSPFVNAVMLTSETPTYESVTISPKELTVTKGQTAQFSATVAGTGFYNVGVEYEIVEATENSTLSKDGKLYVGVNEENTTLTIKAISVGDNSITDTATVTVK